MNNRQSPIFKHAMESFEHGLEHFLDGTDRSRKFALLHIDHAIELLLKEKCIQLGKSIYKSDGTTLSIHETFNSVSKASVSVPEQPRLEELHDLRNTIQHKGLVPDQLTTQFYVEIAYEFVRRFLAEELGNLLDDVLPKRYRTLIEGAQPIEPASQLTATHPAYLAEEALAYRVTPAESATTDRASEPLSTLGLSTEILIALKEAKLSENTISVIISGYTILESVAQYTTMPHSDSQKVKIRRALRAAALARGVSEKKIEQLLKFIFMLRGKVLRGDYIPTSKEAKGYIQRVEKILKLIGFTIPAD